ncbi:MAG: helix-turn-helix transcriptional regulator [Ruminococcus sp.]|nr:helix-turn-helix transcriptional regulator [Ruminococcus sp.]
MSFDRIKIGERISRQRNKLGLTQQDVYDKLEISQNHYSRIENGHVGISIEKLIQLSDILNISIDYILTGKIPSDKKSDFEKKYNELSNKQKQYISQQIDSLKKFDLK